MSNTERSFADRLARGKSLKDAITPMPDYNPQDSDISKEEFAGFLDGVSAKNTEVKVKESDYSTAVADRQEAFYGSNGVKRRATMILNYCKSLKNIGASLKSVARLVAKINNYKTAKTAAPPDPENTGAVKKHSQGEQSYGDLTQAIKDLNEILKAIPAFQPNNVLIQTAALDAFIVSLGTLNESVNTYGYDLSNLKSERNNMYAGLKDRMKRIKSYILGDFGRNSAEYQLVGGIKV
jgi:hypothetical protein